MHNLLERKITFFGLLRFALPTIFTVVFLAFYQMADGVIVARYLGTSALSGLNIVFPIVSFFIAIAIMFSTGGSALVAKELGEKRSKKAKEHFTTIYIVAFSIGVLCALLALIFINPMLKLLGVNENMYGYSYKYLSVLLIFIPIAVLQILAQYFLITVGKPTLAFCLVFLAGIANIVFDIVFINNMNMGIVGASYSSGIAYSIPGLFGVVYFMLNRKNSLHFVKPKIKWDTIKQTCFNGSSEMVSNLAIAITTFFFNIEMLRYLGEDGVAAISIALYAQSFLIAIFFGYSCGVAPIISYYYGKKSSKNLRKIFRISIIFITFGSGLMYLCTELFSSNLVRIFTPEGTHVYDIAHTGLTIFSFSFLLSGFNIFASNLYTALSNGLVSAILAFSRTFLFIVILLMILPTHYGVEGIWLAVPFAEVYSLIVSSIFVIILRRKYKYI